METTEKRRMSKRKITQIFEKTSPQTRGQAARVIDMLVGVRSDPFANKKQADRKLPKGLFRGTDKENQDKLDEG